MNIVAHRREISFLLSLHDDRFVAALKKMPPQLVPRIVPNRVGPLHPFHASTQVRLRGFQQKVIVVSHQHVGMDPPPRPLTRLPQRVQKHLTVPVILKDRFQPVPRSIP